MVNSLKDHTLEAFAKNAGLKLQHASFEAFDDRFEIQSGDRVFIAKFLEGTTQVAKFYETFKNSSVKFLTKEESADLVNLITVGLASSTSATAEQHSAVEYLGKNLPNLGFSTGTPVATYTPPQRNARNWVWSLT